MNLNSTINQRELARRQTITDLALTDRETFRDQATVAFQRLGRRDRKLLHELESKTITAYDILSAWHDTLQPLLEQLESKRTDQVFRVTIKKQLIIQEETLDAKIHELIDERISEARKAFINERYLENSDQRDSALYLLHRQKSELDELLSRLTDYILYKQIADDNSIIVVDAHAGRFRQIRSSILLRRERTTIHRLTTDRLEYIDARKKELLSLNNGLLSAIIEKGWDLILIISLRNQYDKRVSALTKKDSVSGLKRLALFEELTQQFRNDYVEKAVATKISLETTYQLAKQSDELLLRIFDLSTVQKNQLLIQSKEYRELMSERQSLLSVKERTAHL